MDPNITSGGVQPTEFGPVNPSPEPTPQRKYLRWGVLLVVLILLLGLGGYALARFVGGSNDKPGVTPSVEPGVSSDEKSGISETASVRSTQLDVTTLSAQQADLANVVAKALQVTGDAQVQVNLTVGGGATVGGTLQAANFVGNGSQLSGVDAAFLGGQPRSYYEGLAGSVSGLSANAALRNANNTFTANNAFTGVVSATGGLSAANLTVSGSSSLGVTSIASLTLGSALDVSQGGTGLATVAAGGVLYGQGTGALGVATSGSAGLCLISTVGGVAWASCSGGAAVTSLDGLTGALTLANSSGVGSTITIDDATTAAKGIASFNAANFTVTSGAVNTIQNIGTGATPTFAGITLAAPLAVTSGGTGLGSLTLNGVLVGNGTSNVQSVTAGGSGLCLISTAGAPSFQACPGGGAVTSLNGLTGALTVANATGAGATITINDATTAAKGIASFNATNFSTASGAVNTIQNINTGASPTFAGVNTNAITPSGALTVGATSQPLTLQGSNTTISRTSGANVAALTFVAPTANVVYQLQTAAAGTYDVCTTAGNCVGVGGNVSTAGGSANVIPKYTSASAIGPSLLTDNGTVVTVGGNLSVTGTVTLATALGVAQGGTGAVSLTANGVLLGNGTSPISAITGTAGQCLVATAGAPAFSSCPGSGGVASLNGLTGALTLANSSGVGSTITIDDATTAAKGIASFNAANFTVTSGAVNTIQNIGTGATPTFAGVNTNAITPSGALTVGATGQSFTLQGNASSTLTATSGASTTTVGFQVPTANVSYSFATAAAGSYDICTTVGNCSGVGGGITGAGSANTVAKFTGSGTIGNSSITDNGTTVAVGAVLSVNTITPSGALTIGATGQNLTLQGATTQLTATSGGVTNSLQFATPAASNKTVIIPNASGTVAVSASGPLSIDAAGNVSCATCLTSGGGGGGVAAVDSLNGLTGALSIANASGSGATITIDDATTATKGIASFNATNFSVTSGAVNTIQNINSTAAPTFGQLTLTSNQATAPMFVINNTNAGATGNLMDLQLNGSSRFSVSPAGNVSTSGTINGQTISSSASFTGSVAIAGAANLSGGATVTGTLAANTITPSGALTVGATSQSFTLQGNASSSLTATSGANTTTVNFQSPTASVSYRFATAAAGSYDVCTTVGNCAGVGGGITGSGTNGTIAKFTGSGTVGDSLLSESGATVTVAGNLNLTTGSTFQINSTQISSANLSNDANLAKLNATQVFTGGTNTFRNASDSTAAFAIQNAATRNILSVNTTGGLVTLGNITASVGQGLAGALVFADGTNDNFGATLNTSTLTNNRTISLPDEGGTICLQNSANCGFALSTGSGNYIQNQSASDQSASFRISGTGRAATALQAPDFDTAAAGALAIGTANATSLAVGNTSATLTLESSSGGLFIGNGATAHTIQIGTGAATQTVSVGSLNSSSTTAVSGGGGITITTDNASAAIVARSIVNSVTAFQVQNASNDRIFTVDTTVGQAALGKANTLDGKLQFARSDSSNVATISVNALSTPRNIFFPDADGTICVSSGNCGATTGTLQKAYDYSPGGAVSEIVADSTRSGLDIQDQSGGTLGASHNLLSIRGSAANNNTAGAILFGVGTRGDVYIQPTTNLATEFVLTRSDGSHMFNVDTLNQRVGINLGSTNLPSYTLDVAGTTRSTTSVLTPTLDTAAAGTLALGPTTATALTLGRQTGGTNATTTVRGLSVFRPNTDSATAFQIQRGSNGATILNMDSTSTARLTVTGEIYATDQIFSDGDLSLNVNSSVFFNSQYDATSGQAIYRTGAGPAISVSNISSGLSINVAPSGTTGTAVPFSTIASFDAADGAITFKNSGDSNKAFRVQTTGSASVLTVDTSTSVVTVTSLISTADITVNRHLIAGGNAPSIAAGPAACTTPTVAIAGKDTAGLITITSGTGCGATGRLATVTFNNAYGAAPRVVMTPADSTGAGLSQTFVDNATISTTAFQLHTNTAPTNSTTYRWYYQVIQ